MKKICVSAILSYASMNWISQENNIIQHELDTSKQGQQWISSEWMGIQDKSKWLVWKKHQTTIMVA